MDQAARGNPGLGRRRGDREAADPSSCWLILDGVWALVPELGARVRLFAARTRLEILPEMELEDSNPRPPGCDAGRLVRGH
jgi:hypothetical protein